NNSTQQLISTLQLKRTENGGQSIEAKCASSPDQPENITTCVKGFLTSEKQILKGDQGPNLPPGTAVNHTQTLGIMYDINPLGTNTTNSTALRGFSGSWPDA